MIGGVNPPLSLLALLLSATWPSHQFQAVMEKLFHFNNEAPTGAGARADFRKRSVLHKAFSDELAASNTTYKLTAAHCRPNIYTIAWTAA
jgi:hypothetical protein